MFFALSKILLFLFMPLTWVFILIILALFLKKGKWKKQLTWSAGIVLFFFSNTFIADEFLRKWEVKAHNDKDIGEYDLAIVLGGMSGWDARLERIQFHGSSDRLWQALRLYKKGRVKKILITGGSGSLNYQQYKEADFLKQYLTEIGVNTADIYYENQSRNTYENARFSKEIIKKHGLTGKTLLITSGYHLRRAKKCFERFGIYADLYATDRMTGNRRFNLDILLIPNTEALSKWNLLIKEWIGVLTYRAQGWI